MGSHGKQTKQDSDGQVPDNGGKSGGNGGGKHESGKDGDNK